LIEFREVSVRYPSADKPSLLHVSLTIPDGEIVHVRGPSGGGKSTFCLCLNGIIPHLIHADITGDVIINGMNVRDYEVSILSQTVGLVFQNPENQLFAMTVEEDVAFGPENLGLSRNHIIHRVEDALQVTGMTDCKYRQVFNLSGGQKQRTAISGIYAMNPDILVFDEPTADLDPKGTSEVLKTIYELNRRDGKTIILIEHKSEDVSLYCPPDRIITISEGKIITDTPASDYFFTEKRFVSTKKKSSPDLFHGVSDNKIVVEAEGISYAYPDGTQALHDVSLQVFKGEFVSIIGENGCGKSTFLMHLNGLINPPNNAVKICGIPVSKKNAKKITKVVGYLFQNPDNQICMNTVSREIAVGLTSSGISPLELSDIVSGALKTVDLDGYQDRDPNTLSRGERQRLAVASLIAIKPEVLLLDEPTTGQDYDRLCSLMECLSVLNRQGTTILMVTHDILLASSFSDRIIIMKKGRIAYEFSSPFPAHTALCTFACESDREENLNQPFLLK